MGIAKPVRPDFFSRTRLRHERIVVGNAVAAVVADRARRDVLVRVWDNPQNLAEQRIEPLRIASEWGFRLARRAVALTDVHDSPVGVSPTGGWIEHDLARRVRSTGELHAQDLAGSAFECGIRNVRVGPLDDDALDHGLAWGTNHRRGHVCGR